MKKNFLYYIVFMTVLFFILILTIVINEFINFFI